MTERHEARPLSIWANLMDVPFSLRWVDVDGISTRVLEAGSGPPLVLLNGTSGHLECYARNVRDLCERFRVICFDGVGHGYTDKPDTPYTLPVYSDHLLGLLDALGIDRASLSGESLGSWVAAWFAAHHPERVDRLILNTPGNVLMKEDVMARIYESTMRAVREVSPETVRPRLEWLFAEANRWMVTDELVAVRTAIYSQPDFLRAVENILVLQDVETRRRYTWDPAWCGLIEAPTMVMATSDDPTGTPDEARMLASWIPNSDFVLVEGAGHWPQWEKPDEFLGLHLDFLGANQPR
ncbi:MAG: 2-hydroxy-6-ketonona-2,4-dienedioic acid hydrolase [Conexibacter sp.]|nr:2-hydroxy-6-ketonona-2,4-dienedioic acid hydrolase [Conexibacter sp.]